MARLPRILIAHQPHHVLQCGYRGQIVFDGPECYRHYLAGSADAYLWSSYRARLKNFSP